MLHDGDQPVLRLAGLHPRQRFERAAQRRQRVLQFMRDVGRKALDRVEPIVERLGHFAQRPRQMPDLVRARREIRNLLARANAAPHPFGGVGEPANRLGDGVGERQRQDQHHRGEHREEPQDRAASRRR